MTRNKTINRVLGCFFSVYAGVWTKQANKHETGFSYLILCEIVNTQTMFLKMFKLRQIRAHGVTVTVCVTSDQYQVKYIKIA